MTLLKREPALASHAALAVVTSTVGFLVARGVLPVSTVEYVVPAGAVALGVVVRGFVRPTFDSLEAKLEKFLAHYIPAVAPIAKHLASKVDGGLAELDTPPPSTAGESGALSPPTPTPTKGPAVTPLPEGS